MKRSRTVRLALLGSASALALVACDDSQDPLAENKNFFTDPAQCTRSYDSATCSEAFQQAQEEHRTTAPAFGSKEACEEKFGVGNCGWQQGQPSATQAQAQPQGSSFGGGGFFMPLMMGMMMGQMMGGRQGYPLHADRTGATFSGGARVADPDPMRAGRAGALPRTISAPVTPGGAIAQRGSTTRGGFGQTASYRGSAAGG